ncbi:MAG: hypothetical protein GX638_13435 [Crenarchaeota archaeon]|nr:hypothetical protein [Thermoproteota archaeon]
MKQKTLILIFTLLTVKAFADCIVTGIYFWPSGETIKQNSIIVIEGYAESQNIIFDLNKKYPIYLQSGGKKVNLTIKEILLGEYDLTQAILTVDEKLEVGKIYEIFIDSLPDYESSLRKWNTKTKKYETAKWTVIKGIDTIGPTWKKKPVETKKTLAYYGCGPATFVHFNFKIDDKSEFLIKTTVTSLKTKKKSTYYLEPEDSTIQIGHGMCSGAFLFKDGDEYEVSFDIMDASGNLTAWTEKKILFTKPNDENSMNE